VIRIEAVAEEVASRQPDRRTFAPMIEAELARRATSAVGFKTIAAYRTGLDLDADRPSRSDVDAAAEQFLRNGGARLDDPVLIRWLIWTAADIGGRAGLPLQIHSGFGDTDITLHRADPSRFTPLVRTLAPTGVDLVFLHCYPYHREAGAMAAVFPYVSFDVGLALTYVGPSASRVLAEAMEVAPFAKQLYSSDGFGLAELFLVGAESFREALNAVLDGWLAEQRCSAHDAERIAALLAAGNARRVYPAASGSAISQ
jgi:predicted TIM-barrel fold metal-dependent hydrolase